MNIEELKKNKQAKDKKDKVDSINLSTHLFQKQKSSIQAIVDTP